MNIEHKTTTPLDVKFDDDAGTVKAVFATLNVKDSDGDVTLPGFFGKQHVAIAESHNREKIVGKGTIYEDDGEVILEGKYFLETIQGRESFLTAKAMGDLQEWSYGFYLQPGGFKMGQHEGENVRFLQPQDDGTPGVKVAEVSTVLVGAGVGTHTASIKSTDGMRFVEQAVQVAQAAELLFARASEIQELRASKNKTMGDEAVARLQDVKTRLEAVAAMLGDLVTPTVDYDPNANMMIERMVRNANTVLAESARILER